jgi:hypothetical protein
MEATPIFTRKVEGGAAVQLSSSPGMSKALGSISSIKKKKKKRRERTWGSSVGHIKKVTHLLHIILGLELNHMASLEKCTPPMCLKKKTEKKKKEMVW